jgi:thiamine-monophosphate kinase
LAESPQEFELINQIRRMAAPFARISAGIGDDAAVIEFPVPARALLTVDMLMEGVDFTLQTATPFQIGRKALAVNLSDIAAMAGRPLACVSSVALPRAGGFALGLELAQGLQSLANEMHVGVAGGDTNSWNGPVVISVTVLGEATPRGPVPRSGARPADWIMVTGQMGGSLAGKHLNFTPRVQEALALHEAAALHAMIDISDGLAADLHHILKESGAGAVIEEAALPISAAAFAARDGRTPLEHALEDGEDFELLFTVSAEEGRKLLEHPPVAVGLSRIGEITVEPGCRLKRRDGREEPLPPRGWRHAFE